MSNEQRITELKLKKDLKENKLNNNNELYIK